MVKAKEPIRNKYVGHRYVPLIRGEWDQTETYEGLTIVTNEGNSYTSKKRVPVGVSIANEEYWVITGNYNAQIEGYRQDVKETKEQLELSIGETKEQLELSIGVTNDQLSKNMLTTMNYLKDLSVNVKANGVKGDGVTDDTLSIQNVLNLLIGKGGKVYFPEGTYMISDTISIPANITIEGKTKEVSTIKWFETELSRKTMFALALNNANQSHTIRNIGLNQNRQARGMKDDQSSCGIIPRNNTLIEHVKIHNTIGPAISSSNGVDGITIRKCLIFDIGHHDIYFSTSGSSGGYVNNITIEDNHLGDSAEISGMLYGANKIKFRHEKGGDIVKNITIKNNVTDNINGEEGILVYFSTTNDTSECLFENINIHDNTFNDKNNANKLILYGIYFGGNSYHKNVNIINNKINGNSTGLENGIISYGIRVITSVRPSININIKDNILTKFTNGIDANYALVENNYVEFYNRGLLSFYHSKFVKNKIKSLSPNVIAIYRPVADLIENEIMLTGETSIAIQLSDMTGKFIVNNKIIGANTGIEFTGGKVITNCFLDGNIFENVSLNYKGYDSYQLLNHIEPSKSDKVVYSGSNRPNTALIGQRIYDFTLKQPLWWNGTAWGKSDGTPV